MDARIAVGLTVAGGATYAVVSHQLMTHAAGSPFALAALLGPIALGALIGLWRSGRHVITLLLGAALGALMALSASGGSLPPQYLYLAQHAGVHTGLGLWFGSTLLGGEALISRIARLAHREFPPAMAHYTRGVTVTWTVYFFSMAAVSLLLFALAPFSAWSLFANVITPVSMVGLFVGEHLVRYRLHPEFERVGMVDAIRAYGRRDEAAAPPRP